mmetsp:Transcript_90813/g.256482  ORF Transcript_90813/g.256482 Transcript_90813/m.256482 type:complete len:221 (-) Transcript_90813:250-912(-)
MSFCTGSTLRVNTKDTASLLGDDKFQALEVEVNIVPKFSSDEGVDCIKGKFGPFRAHSVAKVPLWAALEMDRLQQCTIDPPDWLHEEELKRMRDEEKTTKALGRVPEFYIEVAFAFLSQSKAYANRQREKERTVLLLRELIETRRSKIMDGLRDFGADPTELNVSDMSRAEITCFRTRSLHALDSFLDLIVARKVAVKDQYTESIDDTTLQDESSSLPPM